METPCGVVEDESQLNLVGITLILRSIGLNRVMLLLEDRDLMKDIRHIPIQRIGSIFRPEYGMAQILQFLDITITKRLQALELQQSGQLLSIQTQGLTVDTADPRVVHDLILISLVLPAELNQREIKVSDDQPGSMGLNLQGVLYAHTAKTWTGVTAFSKQTDNITGPSIRTPDSSLSGAPRAI